MSTYGRSTIGSYGKSIRLTADGEPLCKHGGVTLDWSLFAAAGADVTLGDGVVVLTGEKYCRYGQVICAVTTAEVQTVDVSGDDDPTGGTFDLTILGVDIEGIAWNVSAAALQAAIRAALVDVDGAELITVTKSSFVYTVTFPAALGNVAAITGDATDLTGSPGDTFAITVTTTTAGVSNVGKYGPYDPNASDGRQTLTRGKCFLVNQTVKENDLHSDHPEAIYGGRVFLDRVIQSGVATHTLALGPTFAELIAAFPDLFPVSETPH